MRSLLLDSIKYFLILWILSIVVFFGIASTGQTPDTSPISYLAFLLGVGFFCSLIANVSIEIFKNRVVFSFIKNQKIRNILNTTAQSILFVEVLLFGFLIYFFGTNTGFFQKSFLPVSQMSISSPLIYKSPFQDINLDHYKSEVYVKINAERQANNKRHLKTDPVLEKAALEKAEHMLTHNYWAHVAPDGTEPWYFLNKNNYNYLFAGENLGENFPNTSGLVTAWLNSPEHKKNLMDDNYDETGIAVIHGNMTINGLTGEHLIVVQLFAKKTPFQPVQAGPSRTGNIIPYHEWCTNKEISIYQNELITKQSSDGNYYGMTNDDWNCYENYLKTKTN